MFYRYAQSCDFNELLDLDIRSIRMNETDSVDVAIFDSIISTKEKEANIIRYEFSINENTTIERNATSTDNVVQR